MRYDESRLNDLINTPNKKLSSKEKRERFLLKRVDFWMPEDLFSLFNEIVTNQKNVKSVYARVKSTIRNEYFMIAMCLLIICMEGKYKGINPDALLPMRRSDLIKNIDPRYLREIANWIETGKFIEEA